MKTWAIVCLQQNKTPILSTDVESMLLQNG